MITGRKSDSWIRVKFRIRDKFECDKFKCDDFTIIKSINYDHNVIYIKQVKQETFANVFFCGCISFVMQRTVTATRCLEQIKLQLMLAACCFSFLFILSKK